MRYFDEYNTTTNNYVYNRVRIPYESTCGWCGLGSRCNHRQKQKWYAVKHQQPWTYDPDYHSMHTDFRVTKREATYPNWKLVSKNKKQWMKKDTWKKFYDRRRNDLDYEIKWRGNDRY